jgi:hypothetical protein
MAMGRRGFAVAASEQEDEPFQVVFVFVADASIFVKSFWVGVCRLSR